MKYRAFLLLVLVILQANASEKNLEGKILYEKTNICPAGEAQVIRYFPNKLFITLTCDCECTSQENEIFMYSIKSKKLYLIHASRISSAKSAMENNTIPDTFGPTPLCEKITETQELLVLNKIPNKRKGSRPYCYAHETFKEENYKPCKTKKCINIRKFIERKINNGTT